MLAISMHFQIQTKNFFFKFWDIKFQIVMLKNFNFRQPVNNSHVNDIQQNDLRIHLKTDISVFIQFYS